MPSNSLVGAWGEEQAAAYLRRRGYRIEAARYRCRYGEIDLVASRGRFLAFVEVKLRKNAGHGLAREFVTPRKQQRLILAAQSYLQTHPTQLQPRFDVVEVYAPQGAGGKVTVNQVENAFEAG